jgi:NSS family neurotransmitter:Na+ symporter
MPVLMSEILLGRRGRRNPVGTMELLGEEEGGSRNWRWLGGLAVIGGVLILSYYSVIGGWTLAYIYKSATGEFSGASAAAVTTAFNGFVGDWRLVAFVHTLFMTTTIAIVARGVERGLEQAVKFMVPALLVLMFVLLAYSIKSGHFAEGVAFLFAPNFDQLSWDGALAALGQAFFTLSVGMGAVMAYGAYLPQETSIPGTAGIVVVSDTAIAMLAGLVIFPIVFANGLDPAQGPGLVFQTLPHAFGQMIGGSFFATVFFVLLTLAAWTSAISMMEPSVAWMVERFNRTRAQAATLIGLIIWAVGFGSVLSFNILAEFRFYKGTVFNNVDHLTSNVMLPVGGFLIVIFAGWVMCRNSSSDELGGAGVTYSIWHFLARFVAPVAILFVFLKAVGLLPELS